MKRDEGERNAVGGVGFFARAEEEREATDNTILLRDIQRVVTSARKWLRAVFVVLVVIWLTIITAQILTPLLFTLLLPLAPL